MEENTNVLSETEKLAADKEKLKLEFAASRLVKDPKEVVTLTHSVEDSVKKLKELIVTSQDFVIERVILSADLMAALAMEHNPYSDFPWDISKNIFSEIIDFGLKYTPDLLRLITDLTKGQGKLGPKNVY